MVIRKLSPELSEIAKKELNEDPNRIQEDLKAIRDWLAKQPHLNARTDDQWLIAFLRGCKFSLERTKEKLDMYYTLRSANPEMCIPGDPMDPLIQEILKKGAPIIIPKVSKPGDPRVLIVKPGSYDPDKINVTDIMRVNNMIAIILLLEDDDIVIAGQRVIVDLEGVTMGHFTQMTPSVVKKMVVTGQDVLPIRQKGTHHINTPPGAETIFGFFKQFMNEKNKNRFFVHNKDMEALYKYVPKSVLPKEYGGDAGPIQDMLDDMKKKVESYRGIFLDEVKLKSDESKRIGKPKTSETIFGIEGSFRQLNLD